MATMPAPGSSTRRLGPLACALLSVVAFVLCGARPADAATRTLDTAIFDPPAFASADGDLAFARTRAAGATYAMLQIYWSTVAPVSPPDGFQASDPAEPAYDWSSTDRQVRAAVAHGLEPVVDITTSPRWAQGDPSKTNYDPDATQFGLFARAAAERYSGTFGDLPRVRFWRAWNEPNLNTFLRPQLRNGANHSVELYRGLLSAFSDAVKGVHADNLVIAGGLSPNGGNNTLSTQPLPFMHALLCVSTAARPKRTCKTPLRFDIWSHHPYSSGGPTYAALVPGNASLGDLPAVRAVVAAADRLGQIRHTSTLGFWVTEFSWASDPPSDGGVPSSKLTRWTAEAIHQIWESGFSVVTWFLLRDTTNVGSSGLFGGGTASLAGDTPKPSLAAFRFPFVAYRQGSSTRVWGRTPSGRRSRVLVQQQRRGHWVTRRILRADTAGIFGGYVPRHGGGDYRARIPGGLTAPAFSLSAPAGGVYLPF